MLVVLFDHGNVEAFVSTAKHNNNVALYDVEKMLVGMNYVLVIPVVYSGWWFSMYIASCLCRDEVVEVIQDSRSTDPTSDEWEKHVAQRALGLKEKMKLLSDGWESGLIGVGASFWIAALANFTDAINEPLCEQMSYYAFEGTTAGDFCHSFQQMMFVQVGFCAILPFFLAKDIADTSTRCDDLMDALNEARTTHGPESHFKIAWLETALQKLVR